jgi:hypothetical protein
MRVQVLKQEHGCHPIHVTLNTDFDAAAGGIVVRVTSLAVYFEEVYPRMMCHQAYNVETVGMGRGLPWFLSRMCKR